MRRCFAQTAPFVTDVRARSVHRLEPGQSAELRVLAPPEGARVCVNPTLNVSTSRDVVDGCVAERRRAAHTPCCVLMSVGPLGDRATFASDADDSVRDELEGAGALVRCNLDLSRRVVVKPAVDKDGSVLGIEATSGPCSMDVAMPQCRQQGP